MTAEEDRTVVRVTLNPIHRELMAWSRKLRARPMPFIHGEETVRIAELVHALDSWIRSNGVLPDAWREALEFHGDRLLLPGASIDDHAGADDLEHRDA